MIVEKIQVPTGQPFDFRQRFVDALRIKRAAAVKKASL
jgi:hypothetical protein